MSFLWDDYLNASIYKHYSVINREVEVKRNHLELPKTNKNCTLQERNESLLDLL